MMETEPETDGKGVLDAQRLQWERTFEEPNAFGVNPSFPAQQAAALFKREGVTELLELGGGQGRDTLFFAGNGFRVHVADYSDRAIEAISEKSRSLGLADSIIAGTADVRKPLPFAGKQFDACYSHMLYCMALTTPELEALSREIRRVLKPGGLNIYTVRNTTDAHYKTGIHRGEDMYEVGGYIVHFFSREKIQHLAQGYDVVSIEDFQEGGLPRRLFLVTLRKKGASE